MPQTVIYPGTFDPITNGHLDIILRASRLFPEVLVAVAESSSKKPMFSLEQRVAWVQESCAALPHIKVAGFSGLLVDLARQHQAVGLIRGIRGAADIDYEIQLAQLNEQLYSGLESIILPPSVEWRYLSSTMVRDILLHGGDVAKFVPQAVNHGLKIAKSGGR